MNLLSIYHPPSLEDRYLAINAMIIDAIPMNPLSSIPLVIFKLPILNGFYSLSNFNSSMCVP